MPKISNLYKLFEHWKKYDVIWIYSDTHFSDTDCKLMDPNWPSAEEQVKNINSKVRKNDMLILLGDVGEVEFVKKLNGYKVLLTGNHDRGVSNYLKETNLTVENGAIVERNNRLFDEVYDGPLFINSKTVLSHEPVDLPFGLNIHGHDHSGKEFIEKENSAQCNVCSNVIGFVPKRLDEIVRRFKVVDLHRISIDNARENSFLDRVK